MKRWDFWIDVGGTFTDCVARHPSGKYVQHKTLSSGVVKGNTAEANIGGRIRDPRRAQDTDHLWEGYHIRFGADPAAGSERPVLGFESGTLYLGDIDVPSNTAYELVGPEPAPLVAIRYLLGAALHEPLPPIDLRLGTTRGTNALITRTGSRTALATTQGFRDILRIGYQARPDLFALDIRKPDELYEAVVEIPERIAADGRVLMALDLEEAREKLRRLHAQGIESLAIVLLHACAHPHHEQMLAHVAREVGFQSISLSHEVSSLRKLVPRGDTTVMDAYLNPVLQQYLDSIWSSLHPESELHLMTSSGGLVGAEAFRGKDSILSGPAGGVVGVAHVARTLGRSAAIGFDMGGTSTDVSRWSQGDGDDAMGEFELQFEGEKAGQRMATPMMAIETVAAGGGSICRFDGVKFTVGPQSAGADPGPACYGRGGPLAVTDINLYLGRIPRTAFPFSLDDQAVQTHLERQAQELCEATGDALSPTEIAAGYLQIANASMAEAIRCVTVQRGVDARQELLVAFGGAAAQHACAVADELGIAEVAIHPSAGILSAMGIGMAQVAVHEEKGVYRNLDLLEQAELQQIFSELESKTRAALGAEGQDLVFRRYLDLRFFGLDTALRIREPDSGDFRDAYREAFRARSGYLPESQEMECVTARVTASLAGSETNRESHVPADARYPSASSSQEATFDGQRRVTPVYRRTDLSPGDTIEGPAIIAESISAIVVEPRWQARVATGGEVLLTRTGHATAKHRQVETEAADPILLEVFHKRFAAIATQMGATLRKTSRSVNVKERLDYSCAIFTAQGELVVNAPHIPVHLGAMGATVRHIMKTMPLHPNDVIVTNDPYHGGSHLPDVTVVTPVHDDQGQLMFFTASRAHHAEIGGIAPGSMPAFSKNLAEEGKLIRATKVIAGGESKLAELQAWLAAPPYPSRDPGMNLADITAQIAANRMGLDNLLRFVDEYSWPVVSAYMDFIQQAAETKTRRALGQLAQGGSLQRQFTDHLDDGTPISVTLSIQGEQTTIDFTGTGPVSSGNLNANPAIVTAATLYCLRLLIDEDMPLNDGVLRPITLEIPVGLLNPPAHDDPARCPGIVGGNVETSQRIVDVLLGAMGIAAASQGTMNNLLFGDDTFGYYETVCGGSGATAHAAGADAVHTHMTNTRLTDPEVFETRFPVRLRRFEIRENSGGLGQHRGGHGVLREIEFLRPLHVSLITQRRAAFAPYGIQGGEPGSTGRNVWIRRGAGVRPLASLDEVSVEAGDIIRIETPGGGGFGDAGPGANGQT